LLINQIYSNEQLEEKYCACLFFELRTFYDRALICELVKNNPFSGCENPFRFPEKLFLEDLPKLSDVDMLLNACSEQPDIYAAVLLAFRMGLTTSEIVNLEKKSFCLDEKRGNIYLKMWRWADGEKKELFLYVPRDIVAPLKMQNDATPTDYPYFFRSKKTKKPLVKRGLQLKLEKVHSFARSAYILCSWNRFLCRISADMQGYAGTGSQDMMRSRRTLSQMPPNIHVSWSFKIKNILLGVIYYVYCYAKY